MITSCHHHQKLEPKRRLYRLDPDTFTDPHMREVVEWHLLMSDTDTLSELTGLGLADVWGFIRAGAFQSAAVRLLEHADAWAQIHEQGHS